MRLNATFWERLDQKRHIIWLFVSRILNVSITGSRLPSKLTIHCLFYYSQIRRCYRRLGSGKASAIFTIGHSELSSCLPSTPTSTHIFPWLLSPTAKILASLRRSISHYSWRHLSKSVVCSQGDFAFQRRRVIDWIVSGRSGTNPFSSLVVTVE